MSTELGAGHITLTVRSAKAMGQIRKDLLGLDKTAKKAGTDAGKALSTGLNKSTKLSSTTTKSYFNPFVRQGRTAGADAGKALSRGFNSSVDISTGSIKSALSGVTSAAASEGKQAGSKFGTNFLSSAKGTISSGGRELLEGVGAGAQSAMGNVGALAGGSFLAGIAPKIAQLGTKAGPVGLAFAAAAGVALAAGAVVGDQFMKGVERQTQRNEIKVKAGLDEAQAAAVFKQAETAYANNFGTSIKENTATATALIQSGLSTAGDAELTKMIGQVATVAQVTGASTEEIIKATNSMVKSGVVDNVQEAMDVLVKGQQEGLNASGDLLDTFNEYSVQFEKVGVDGKTALGLINQLMEGGARNSDLAADAIKEFSIRAVDGSELTNKAFSDLGFNWQEMQATLANPETARAGLDQILTAFQRLPEGAKKSELQVALFGTQAEDLGDALNNLDLDTAADSMGDIAGEANKAGNELSAGPTAGFTKLGRQVEVAKGRFQDLLVQGLGPIAVKLADLIQDHLPDIIRLFGKILKVGVKMAKGVLDFIGDITIAVGELVGGFGNVHGAALRVMAVLKRLTGNDEEADRLDAQADAAFGWGESIKDAGKKIKEQAKGLDKYADGIEDTTEEMANATEVSDELGESIEVMPDKKRIKVTTDSPQALKKLKDLGYTTRTLPDGTVEVVAETDEAQDKMDSWRRQQTGEPLPIKPTVDKEAVKKYKKDLEKQLATAGGIAVPLGDPSLIPDIPGMKPHGSGPDATTNQGSFASAGLMPNALRIGSEIHGAFPNMVIGGKRADRYPDHPSGKAIDVMVGDNRGGHILGDRLFSRYIKDPGVNYILWKQTEFHPDGRKIPMGNRGNRTENHFDHLHIMTRKRGGGIPGYGGGDKVPALLEGGEHVFTKDDVKAMGGQYAVYDFRKKLRSGLLKFSTGGRVPDWDAIAQKESSGNWHIPSDNQGQPFRGGLQILDSTWVQFGGTKYAPTANLATREEQIAVAEAILAGQGPGAWPNTFTWKTGSGSTAATKGVTAEQRSSANANAAKAQNDLDVALAERDEMAKDEAYTTEERNKRLAEKDAEIAALKRARDAANAKADRYGSYPLGDEEDPVIAAEEDAREQQAILDQEKAKLADLKASGAVQSEIIKQQGVVDQQQAKVDEATRAIATARAEANDTADTDTGSGSDNPFVKITEGIAELADLGVGGLKETLLPPGFSDPMEWPAVKALGGVLGFVGGLVPGPGGNVLRGIGSGLSGGGFSGVAGELTPLIPSPDTLFATPSPNASHYGTGAPPGPGGEPALVGAGSVSGPAVDNSIHIGSVNRGDGAAVVQKASNQQAANTRSNFGTRRVI